VAFAVTVNALDAANNVATGTSATVDLTSNDPLAFTLGSLTLTNGTGQRPVTLNTPCVTITINAHASATSAPITDGTAAVNVLCNSTSTVDHLLVVAPACVTPGSVFTVLATALRPDGTVDTSFDGVVHLSSSDPLGSVSGDATLTAGSGTFSAILLSSGAQTIGATGTLSALAGSTTVSLCQVATVVPSTPAAPSPLQVRAQFTG